MTALIFSINQRLDPLRLQLERLVTPLALLLARLMVANVFFTSGWLKFGYVLNDQLDTLYFLFEDYNVPLLPVKVAAWMGMFGELGFAILLGLGLFGRVGALGLIAMSALIYSVDHNHMAPYWAMLCGFIAIQGPGVLSLDTLIWRRGN